MAVGDDIVHWWWLGGAADGRDQRLLVVVCVESFAERADHLRQPA